MSDDLDRARTAVAGAGQAIAQGDAAGALVLLQIVEERPESLDGQVATLRLVVEEHRRVLTRHAEMSR